MSTVPATTVHQCVLGHYCGRCMMSHASTTRADLGTPFCIRCSKNLYYIHKQGTIHNHSILSFCPRNMTPAVDTALLQKFTSQVFSFTLCFYSTLIEGPAACSLFNAGRFIMFSVITNIYNKKTKGPALMGLFTATGKLIFF